MSGMMVDVEEGGKNSGGKLKSGSTIFLVESKVCGKARPIG